MRRVLLSAGIAGVLALGAVAPVFAQGPGCVALCAVSCVKPISIPDRWDDSTPIAGYDGSSTKRPNWRNNNAYDQEGFVDSNANGFWDPGESYTDGNGNGIYDHEAYDPLLTGYRLSVDLGTEIELRGSAGTPGPGQYMAIDFPPVNKGTPLTGAEPYRTNWSECNPGSVGGSDRCLLEASGMSGPTNKAMRDLIAQDPDAYWDPATGKVSGSNFAQSPRVIFVAVHDPRVPVQSATSTVNVTKVIAVFMEEMTGNASVRVRFVQALGAGDACGGGGAGFIVECPTPAHTTSWGRVKDLYR